MIRKFTWECFKATAAMLAMWGLIAAVMVELGMR